MVDFSYEKAFSRNIGWLTEQEQRALRLKTIAIGGLGGVGGSYLIALTRLGVENFKISDLDHFDLSNFNRQVGATLSSIQKPKIEILSEMAREINPGTRIASFERGLNETNFKNFLDGADLYLDSLDLYATPLKMRIFDHCYEQKIPIISAAPIGMSTSLLIFTSSSMSPQDYFGIDPSEPVEIQMIRFLVGMNPTMKSLRSLVELSGVELRGRKLPSLPMGIELCTAGACTSALKLLLHRGPILAAPFTTHFDAYANSQFTTWRPFGHRNPLQKWMVHHIRKKFLIG